MITIFVLQEVKEIFEAFDKDHNGALDFDEFLISLRVSTNLPRLLCKQSYILHQSIFLL